MLVLCAGRGHDARLFARHGFEVTAVDFAEEAVKAMAELTDPEAPLEVQQADLFSLPTTWDGGFDYVLEHTCFSAIDPERREEYFREVSRLLKPGGHYIAVAFPIGTRPGGPPFTYQPGDIAGPLMAAEFEVILKEAPEDSPPGRQGHEELLILRKRVQDDDQ
jgi:ubiquinone/menaquinone biosynthesis C-methylase UbiE